MSNVATLLGLRMPEIYNNKNAVPLKCADPSLYYGLELEIENVPNWEDLVVHGMTSVEDGSLRNHGREFLTKPSSYSIVMHTLQRFFDKAKLSDDNYSERCSVHVHANTQNMTTDQVASVCLLYQVFEKLLYAFVGGERDKNIFCIPWDQTTLSYQVISSLNPKNFNVRSWQKYTGLNLLPLLDKGTLEFRQLGGTYDLEKIGNWLNLIGSLFVYAKQHPLDKIKQDFVMLNTTSAYSHMTENVFTSWAHLLMSSPGYKIHLEEGVLNMKYSLVGATPLSNPFKAAAQGILDDLAVMEDTPENPPTQIATFVRGDRRPSPPPRERTELNRVLRNPFSTQAVTADVVGTQAQMAGTTTAQTTLPHRTWFVPDDNALRQWQEAAQAEAVRHREEVIRAAADNNVTISNNRINDRGEL